jgi:16S rRNA (guanine966-N2)-methyltransferase
MRIIAGQRRGHKIEGPAGPATRPTSDLVRESIFNILRDQVEDRPVLDLFAGTGALGLEALSRGATRALFVEKDPRNAAVIRRNIATLRYEDRARVVLTNAYSFAKAFQADPNLPWVVFLDPPYVDYERKPRQVAALLLELTQKLPPDSIVVTEAGDLDVTNFLPSPDTWDVRRYGGTKIALHTVSPAPEITHPEAQPDLLQSLNDEPDHAPS